MRNSHKFCVFGGEMGEYSGDFVNESAAAIACRFDAICCSRMMAAPFRFFGFEQWR